MCPSPGMGELPQACGVVEDVRKSETRDLVDTVAVVATEAPKQRQKMDQEQVLPQGRNEDMGVCGIKKEKGRTVMRRLYEIGRTRIARYVRIRAEANPFDHRWEPYFEQRALSKLLQGEEGRLMTIL